MPSPRRAVPLLAWLLPLALVTTVPSARAQEPAAASDATAEPDWNTTWTVAVSRLLRPVFEVKVERQLTNLVGAALLAGAGFRQGDQLDDIVALGAGGQFLVYPLGSFGRGVQAGVQVRYAYESGRAEASDGRPLEGTSHGVHAGPFVGTRWTTRSGVVAEVQVGYGVSWRSKRASCCGGLPLEDEDTYAEPAGTLNLGWAF